MKKLAILLPVLVFAPVLAFAQDFSQVNDFFAAIWGLITNILIPLVFALAVLGFLWGLFKTFILGGTDEGKREEGKKLMLWSIIAFVVMVALWGIVEIVMNVIGIDSQIVPEPPKVPSP